ncbi:unnamed protein product [Cyprideis torosa]|uniref:Uncharacterized protein n=1 Tax=Cyprideis torosa TaxID=163714 RepID=A0A7R8WA58_9CRUS|nr:unnamed protein product [Cyprideis torosa]CAG0885122.1 unnamed protein product [Cyprideis torosa]
MPSSVSTVGTQSVRSLGVYSTRSTRTVKSSKWDRLKKPLVEDAFFTSLQNGGWLTGIFSIVLAFFTIATQIFDIYCLILAAPGVAHYGYYLITYDFVFAGNPDIRRALIIFAFVTLLLAIGLVVTATMLLMAFRNEREKGFVPWLVGMPVFFAWRIFHFVFYNFVNDLIFGYHAAMLFIWLILLAGCVYGWIVVYSFYLELCDLTRMEDLAKLKAMSSLSNSYANQSMSLSYIGAIQSSSRPTTPRGSTSTNPGGVHGGSQGQLPGHNVSMSTDIM